MNFRDVLGGVLVGSFITVLGALLWKDIPKQNEQLIVYMLGQLSGFVSAVVALHYVQKAGENELEQTRAENTGEAFKAIKAAAQSLPPGGGLNSGDRPAGTEEDPVHTTEESNRE